MSKKKKLSDIDLEILNNPPYPLQDPIKWMKWKAMKPSEQYQKTLKRTMHTSGNIGVTTTQQMIQAQRDIVRFTVYDTILQDFKERFCVQVY